MRWTGGLFFVVSCAVDPGLLSVLREHIGPPLKAEVPNQPTEEQLEADPLYDRLRPDARFLADFRWQEMHQPFNEAFYLAAARGPPRLRPCR